MHRRSKPRSTLRGESLRYQGQGERHPGSALGAIFFIVHS